MIDSNLMSEIQDAAAQGKDTLAPQNGYQVGATYLISHTRKGRFFMRVTGQSDECLNGIVVAGTAKAMLDYNVKEAGDEVTLRKSFITSAVVQP